MRRARRKLGWLLLAAGLLTVSAAAAQDRLARMQQQFESESDAVRKARRLPRLGEMQLEQLRQLVSNGQLEKAFRTLEAYRDNVRAAHDALDESGIDAERRPRGFRQMEIHLRRSVRELSDTISRLPVERREEFEAIHAEIVEMQTSLIDMLFPRQPGRRAEDAPRAGGLR
jgi:hypothetical protein